MPGLKKDITAIDTEYLYHATRREAIAGIQREGICRGGPRGKRCEAYFGIMQPKNIVRPGSARDSGYAMESWDCRQSDEDNASRLLRQATMTATLYNEYLTQGDYVVQVDVASAIAAGCEFYQTTTGAVLCSNMDIPLEAIETIYDPFNNFPVYTRRKTPTKRSLLQTYCATHEETS